MRQYQPSNVARELKQKLEVVRGGGESDGRQSNDFVLGVEPQGGVFKEPQGGLFKEPQGGFVAKQQDVKPSTASRF